MGNIVNKQIKYDETIKNSDGNYKRLATEFFYDKIILEDYFFRRTRGLHICVSYDWDWQKYITPTKCKTPELLCKMLILRGKIPDELFRRPLSRDSDLTDDVLCLIIDWCKINGYPFKPDFKNKPKQRLFSPTEPERPIILFWVCDFLNRLDEIYNAYLLYWIITGQKNYDLKNKYDNLGADECKVLFEKMYHKISFANQISFDGEIHWETKTDNLFDAVFYQLVLLLNNPNSKQGIGICPLCNSFFEREHASQIYCMNVDRKYKRTCYPQKQYKKTKRERSS